MILQALTDYYRRKCADPDVNERLAPAGFESKEIPFILELDKQGKLVQIEDTREVQGKKKIGRTYLVPQGVKKTSGVAANLLWDTAEYVLGIDTRGKPDRVKEQHKAFVDQLDTVFGDTSDPGLRAVVQFLANLDLTTLETLPQWEELQVGNPNLTFRLQGDIDLVCQRPGLVEVLQKPRELDNESEYCLVSGDRDEIERLHPAIKGVWGAQTSGANIVSFNLPAFNSFGKEQGSNAPVGKRAAFAYTTSLNYLLRRESKQRLQVGDASTVFWAEKPNPLETGIVDAFGEPPKDDPDRNVLAVKGLYESSKTGGYAENNDKTRFYVLGLAPNAARIAIRFWYVSTVAQLALHICQHFDDLEISRPPYAQAYPTLFRLLLSIAVQGKADNIPPNLAGDVMRSILAGLPYPQTLLQAAVRRIRAERDVSYLRVALIKACINRDARCKNPDNKEELKVSLDLANPNKGYRLGRLFAVLEKIQIEAFGGPEKINANIRDRFYGAASSTPVTVFSNLMKLKNHHLSKLEPRKAVYFEKLLGEIISDIDDFPSLLALPDQGRFAIGYYHQQQAFYTKSQQSTQGE